MVISSTPFRFQDKVNDESFTRWWMQHCNTSALARVLILLVLREGYLGTRWRSGVKGMPFRFQERVNDESFARGWMQHRNTSALALVLIHSVCSSRWLLGNPTGFGDAVWRGIGSRSKPKLQWTMTNRPHPHPHTYTHTHTHTHKRRWRFAS